MIVEYEAVAIGAAAVAAVLIWNKIRIWKRMRAIDVQLTKLQKEIDILQKQESSRLSRLIIEMTANSKVEAPKIDPDSGPVETGSADVVRLVKTPPTTPA